MRRVLFALILSVFTLLGYAQQYEMEFGDNDLGTLYLDFPVAIPNDEDLLGVYYLYGIKDDEALLTRIRGYIPANTGVMVHSNTHRKHTFYKTDANVPPLAFANLFSGSVVDITPAEALANAGASSTSVVMTYGRAADTGMVGFYRYTGKLLKANKAFVIYDTATGGNINSLTFTIPDDDPDGIRDVKATNDGETWHTLQGVRLNSAPTLPGIYIRNGRAVTVK